jgi:hypothetical protein
MTPEERNEPPDKSMEGGHGQVVRTARMSWGNRLSEELGGRKEAIVIVGAWAVFGLYHVVNAFSRSSDDHSLI